MIIKSNFVISKSNFRFQQKKPLEKELKNMTLNDLIKILMQTQGNYNNPYNLVQSECFSIRFQLRRFCSILKCVLKIKAKEFQI